jgi:hypothetical protein
VLSCKRLTDWQDCKLDEAKEAQLITVPCRAPAEGRTQWTMKLLTDKWIARDIVDSIRVECVCTPLKKRPQTVYPQQWVIPPQVNIGVVCAIEDVLAGYICLTSLMPVRRHRQA